MRSAEQCAHRDSTKTTTILLKPPPEYKNARTVKMRPIILTSLFAIAVVAIPVAIEIENGKHLEKRGMDSVLADLVKAAITFGAFIWGGGIIAKRAVNYYFVKKEEVEKEKIRSQLMAAAKMQQKKAELVPQPLESTLVDVFG